MARPRILILDDDQDFLDICRQIFSTLPSDPEILTVDSGARALSLLESEPFALLLTDLRMPQMDGFQVLSVVRKRLPLLRIVVLTGLGDDHSRARAYEIGIDLYVEKPKSARDRQLFLECVEAMLERDTRQSGFRGVVECKALPDIIQLECLTQSSAVVKITSGRTIGYLWFRNGEIIDAATATAKAEAAFKEILSWKVGSFDLLAPDMVRARTIFTPTQALLLDTAQALDEAKAGEAKAVAADLPPQLAAIEREKGVQFLVEQEGSATPGQWACEDPAGVAAWARRLLQEYRALGEKLGIGEPLQWTGYGPQRHLAVSVARREAILVAGFAPELEPGEVSSAFHKMTTQWAS